LEEFSQIFLPAANQLLRSQVDARTAENSGRPLPDELLKLVAKLVEKEIGFQLKKDNIRR
jgi:hypothetical protein